MAEAIRLRAVVALSGRFPVLAGADLTVENGEVILLRGANGAGKTSLLRVCAGLIPVVQGQAEVLGHDLVVDRRTVRRLVGMLGHAGSLYDDLTAAQNVRFWARAAGRSAADADRAMERVGLAGRLPGLAVSHLSAGQRRRTALACLVARSPRLWLLDEPHAGLDADGRAVLDSLVLEAAQGGATVLLASHESGRVEELAARTVVVAGGRTQERVLVA